MLFFPLALKDYQDKGPTGILLPGMTKTDWQAYSLTEDILPTFNLSSRLDLDLTLCISGDIIALKSKTPNILLEVLEVSQDSLMESVDDQFILLIQFDKDKPEDVDYSNKIIRDVLGAAEHYQLKYAVIRA